MCSRSLNNCISFLSFFTLFIRYFISCIYFFFKLFYLFKTLHLLYIYIKMLLAYISQLCFYDVLSNYLLKELQYISKFEMLRIFCIEGLIKKKVNRQFDVIKLVHCAGFLRISWMHDVILDK